MALQQPVLSFGLRVSIVALRMIATYAAIVVMTPSGMNVADAIRAGRGKRRLVPGPPSMRQAIGREKSAIADATTIMS